MTNLQALWQKWIESGQPIVVTEQIDVSKKNVKQSEIISKGHAVQHEPGGGITRDLLLLKTDRDSYCWIYPDRVSEIKDPEAGNILYSSRQD